MFNSNNKQINMVGLQGSTIHYSNSESLPRLDNEGRDLDPPAVDFDLAALGLEFSESNFAFLLEETAALGAACCISANLDFLFDDSTDLANFDAVGFDAVELTPAVVLEADSRA